MFNKNYKLMKIVKAILQRGEWLLDALKRIGHSMIPSNCILNKTLTGLGATHSEIHSKRSSIIIEPNIPVILGKLDDNDNLEAVYAKCTPYNLKKYLKMDIKYKKIITTPESFYKVRKAAEELDINIYKTFFCLFDECEKVTQDIDYRRKISQPIYDFFRFEQKAFVSATPLPMSHPEFERQGFQMVKIEPSFDYKKNLTLIVTNSYYMWLQRVLDSLRDSKHICIFFNVTDGITELINNLGITDYKVFCSQESVDKLLKRGIVQAYSQIDYPLAKYNFFTCRFYSALDIRIAKHKPDIIILTDHRTANWTIVDPFTEAIQIQGRFRRRGKDDITYNSLTHISTVNPDIRVRSKEEIGNRVERFIATYNLLKKIHDEELDEFKKQAILEDIDNLKYQDLIDERGEINPFSVDNLYNEERVRSYYQSAESLYQAYINTGFFNVEFIDAMNCVGDDDIERLNNTKIQIDQRKQILQLAIRIEEWFMSGKISYEDKEQHLNYFKQQPEGNYVLNAYEKIGKDAIVSAEYKRGLIDRKVREFDKAQANKLRFSENVLKDIQREFPLGVYIPKKDIQQRLQMILQDNGVQYKATQDSIRDYYEVNESNSKELPSFRLNVFKFPMVDFLDAPI